MELNCGPCKVRSWREDDKRSLPRHANNRKVWLQLRDRFPHPYAAEDATAYMQHVALQDPEVSFAIDVAGEAVGGISLMLHDDVERCSAEIGYWLGEEFWGGGIVSAALRSITEYAFETFDLTRVFALPFAGNAASVRVLEKAGYVFEGVLRRSAIKDGKVLDQLMYAITDEQLSDDRRGGAKSLVEGQPAD